MRYSRFFARLLLIFLIPSQVVYPQAMIPVVQTHQEAILGFLTWDDQLSYDAVLDLIEKIEEDDLDGYTEKDLERIEHFFISLAREGILPNETQERLALERDIEILLSGSGSQYYFACDHGNDGFFYPAIFDGQGEIVHCKGSLKKFWDNTRHFVKKT